MENWTECSLGDLVTFQRGFDITSKDLVSGDIPIVSSSGIREYHNEFKAESPGVVIGRKGTLGTVHYLNTRYWPHDTTLWVKNFHGNEPLFIYYFLKTLKLEDYDVGTSNPTLNRNHIHLLKVTVPTPALQRRIAEVLKSLDDKIDVLHRQNKTLEAMAETLFRQWFVEEAEESWETESLEKHFDISIGRTPPRNQHQWFSIDKEETKWASIKDMGASGVYINSVSEYLTEEAIRKFHIPIIPANTTILSFKMTVGRIKITTESMVSNEAIAQFQVKDSSPLYSEFIYLFLKKFRWQNLGSTSSIVDAINTKIIREIEIPVADKNKLDLFRKIIKPHFRKMLANQTQMNSLSKLRDELLPRLMKGEVILKS